MCRTGMCRFGIGNWIFLLAAVHLFTYAQGADDEFVISPEPESVWAAAGLAVRLACGGRGGGAVSWRHSAGGLPTREHTLNRDDKYRKQLPNGTLVISSLSASLAGHYQCVAALDGVGTIVSRVATVYLAEPPKPVPPFRSLSVPQASTVLLPCGLRADPPRQLQLAPARRQKTNIPTITVNVSWEVSGAPVQYSESLWRCGAALVLEAARPHHAGNYSCRAALSGGAAVAGDPIELKVTEGGESEYPPQFIVTPQSETVIEGATVTFDCAAIGNPKPEIVWLFNGNPIDLSSLEAPASVLSCGSLSLQASRRSAGAYTCRAQQLASTIDHTATLTVQTPPTAQASPLLLTPHPGGTARLECRGGGSPGPRLSWLKDGEPLTPNHSDVAILNGGTLAISGVLPVDAGMFQCMATSPAGNSLANVRLVVKDPPTDIQKDVSTLKQKIDPKYFLNSLKTTNNMSMYYQKPKKPTEKPKKIKPNSTQDIFNSLISSSSVNALDDNSDFLGETSSAYTLKPEYSDAISTSLDDFHDYDLEINNTFKLDQNTDDNSFHAAKGLDFDKFGNGSSIPAPKDLRAVIVKHRFVTLSWEAVNYEDLAGYAVICKVKGSDRKRIIRVSNSEATVSSLKPNTTYVFSVRTLSSTGASTPSQELESVTGAVSAGSPPRLVALTPRDPHSVLVSWQPTTLPGGGHYSGNYAVYYTEASTGREQVLHVPGAATSQLVGGLVAGARYWVAVGAGGHLSPARGVTTPLSVGPPDLAVRQSGTHSLLVQWTGATSSLGYRIRYRAVGMKAETITTPADVNSIELDNLEPGTTYQVRICALLSNGTGPFSEWVPATTAPRPGAPPAPAPPPKIHTRAGRDWIYVWWGEEEDMSQVEEAGESEGDEGWQLGWGKGVPDERGEKLPASARSRKITNLEPNTEYVLSLRATLPLGLSPPVYSSVRTRPRGGDVSADEEDYDEAEEEEAEGREEVLIPPVGVKAIMLSATTAVVYWTDPTLPKGQPASGSRVYVVRWWAGSGPKRYFNATDLNCMIDDLKPYTEYEFAVKMIKGSRWSAWSMVVVNRSLEAPPGPPGSPRAAPAPAPAPRALQLVWAPPAQPNGVITGYVVMYAPVLPPGEWAMTSVVTPRARLERLRPLTQYQIKVQARNSRGLGPFSGVLYYTTPNELNSGGLPSATSAWLWASAGGACCVMALAAALALSLCCRRRPDPLPTSTYQKSSATAALKPPDLWIHHDQMELKHLDKSMHSSAVSAGSAELGLASSSLCLSREYSPPRPDLDRRHYVPAYVDGIGAPSVASGSDLTAECRASPPPRGWECHCRYNTMGGVGVGSMSSMGNPPAMGVGCASTCDRRMRPHHEQSALSPACSASLAHLHLHAGTPSYAGPPSCGDVYSCVSRGPGGELREQHRERGHYVAYEPLGHYTHRDSLSSDLPPPGAGVPPAPPTGPGVGGSGVGGPGVAGVGGSLPRRGALHSFSESDHSTPTHSNRSGRECSPYKKSAASSPAHHSNTTNRLHLGSSVPHHESELEPLTPSRSTERLQREMQNLEGLMKDLSAITQHQFHC